jgi:hypothetical protein
MKNERMLILLLSSAVLRFSDIFPFLKFSGVYPIIWSPLPDRARKTKNYYSESQNEAPSEWT